MRKTRRQTKNSDNLPPLRIGRYIFSAHINNSSYMLNVSLDFISPKGGTIWVQLLMENKKISIREETAEYELKNYDDDEYAQYDQEYENFKLVKKYVDKYVSDNTEQLKKIVLKQLELNTKNDINESMKSNDRHDEEIKERREHIKNNIENCYSRFFYLKKVKQELK